MYPSFIAIFKVKLKYQKLITGCRNLYLKVLGLQLKPGCTIGKIECDWLSKLIIGECVEIRDHVCFWFRFPFDSDSYISIGNQSFIGRNCEFNCNGKIKIGNNCLIASNTVFVDSSHSFLIGNNINIQPVIISDIEIEDDVWIGSGCTILMGTKIAHGAIVAAGAVVTKSIPSNEIWAGVPAKKIGERKEC